MVISIIVILVMLMIGLSVFVAYKYFKTMQRHNESSVELRPYHSSAATPIELKTQKKEPTTKKDMGKGYGELVD